MKFNSLDELRTHRNTLLTESDAWLLPDFPMKVDQELLMPAILAYRTELRNWPAVEDNLEEATVPTKPAGISS